jgi:hypothetical protein
MGPENAAFEGMLEAFRGDEEVVEESVFVATVRELVGPNNWVAAEPPATTDEDAAAPLEPGAAVLM